MYKFVCFAAVAHLAFLTTFTYGEVGLQAVTDVEGVRILELRGSNTLKCDIVGDDDEDDLEIVWKRDGKAESIKNDPEKFLVSGNSLTIRRTSVDDVTTYSCEISPKGAATISKEIKTIAKPWVKINAPAVVIEGQKMKLECLAHGKPTPEIVWKINNETYDESEGRVRLSSNSEKHKNGLFEIDVAELTDRGDYSCIASNEATDFLNATVDAQTYVRVKDKLAAVWPFIGICAEVIILCAIIFVYERNRTKTELDESDTDGGADQKAGDHQKDSVRQRK